MKKYFLILVLCFNTIGFSQDLSYLSINPIVPDFSEDSLNEISKSNIENKLHQIATNYGISGLSLDPIFAIRPNFIIESMNTIRGLESQNVVKMEMILYIENTKDKIVYNTCSIKLKGIGGNQIQACNDAIVSLSVSNKQLEGFISKSKSKIVAYYDKKCSTILDEAKKQANISNYEGAIATLYAIPTECSECFKKTIFPILEYYKIQINYNCRDSFLKAKVAYSQKNYEEVNQNLMKINPESDCYNDAKKFTEEISNKDFEFEMKKYDNGINLEQQRLISIKEIAITYAQKKEAESTNVLIVK